jgi:hypothetical protein
MLPFKTTSLNVSAGAVIGNGLTVTGDISASNVIYAKGGNSDIWNSANTSYQGASGSFILDGGNTKGSNILIGTNDNYNLVLETGGSTRMTISSAGPITLSDNNTMEFRTSATKRTTLSTNANGGGLTITYVSDLNTINNQYGIFVAGGPLRVTGTDGYGTSIYASGRISSGIVQCPSIGSVQDGNAGWVFGSTVAAGSSVTSVNLPAIVRYGGTTNLFPSLKRINEGLQVRLADDTNFAPLTASNITATGTVFASGGNSSLWNSAYTTVQSNSASWEESADILPTVTNYLSTNNVLMSEATITNNLIVGGTVYSSGSADVLAKYTEIIGNGTSFSINHNFLTSDVQVQVHKVSDGVLSYPTVEITSISAVTVKFAQSIPAASYKVIVHGTVPSNQINAYGGTTATEFQSLTFNTSSYELSITNGNTVSLASLSSTGSGITTDKKFDYVTVFDVDYSYSGTAVQGTLDTSSTWKLIRLTYNNNGTISNSASAINSWTGRLTATYI